MSTQDLLNAIIELRKCVEEANEMTLNTSKPYPPGYHLSQALDRVEKMHPHLSRSGRIISGPEDDSLGGNLCPSGEVTGKY